MIVRSVEMVGFMPYAEPTRVALEPTGLTLVTGANGEGKSSILEAVAWAHYGKTLRGADPHGEAPCQVSVRTERHSILRRRYSGNNHFRWRNWDEEDVVFESATHAQKALLTQVMPFSVWRRACVMSSADASSFMGGADAERKRLIEGMFDLDVFDRALALAREDLATDVEAVRDRLAAVDGCRIAHRAALDELARLRERVDGAAVADARLSAARRALAEAKRVAVLAQASRDGAVGRFAEARSAAAVSRSVLDAARARLRAASSGTCSACGQPVAEAALVAAAGAEAAAALAHAELSSALGVHERLAGDAAGGDVATEGVLHRAEVEYDAARAAAALVGEIEKLAAGAADRSKLAAARLLDVVNEHAAACLRASVRRGAVDVLGVRGVRSRILDRVLVGLQDVANSWLERLHPDARLALSSQSELRDGRVVDKISAEIDGMGGGRGYWAASGGERRRVDLAVTLAFCDAAAAVAVGGAGSTLWLDEVVDNLDADGLGRVAEVLRDLARERHVVVISHSTDLIAALAPDRHLHVAGGQVVER